MSFSITETPFNTHRNENILISTASLMILTTMDFPASFRVLYHSDITKSEEYRFLLVFQELVTDRQKLCKYAVSNFLSTIHIK